MHKNQPRYPSSFQVTDAHSHSHSLPSIVCLPPLLVSILLILLHHNLTNLIRNILQPILHSNLSRILQTRPLSQQLNQLISLTPLLLLTRNLNQRQQSPINLRLLSRQLKSTFGTRSRGNTILQEGMEDRETQVSFFESRLRHTS